MRPLNIAHRGSSGLAPEHTFAAYDLALSQGVDYIEIDLQLTRDQVLVAVHDATLDRTARGAGTSDRTGTVRSKTLEQIKRCDAGTWFNASHPEHARERFRDSEIPTLEEIFERYGADANYYIEAKNPDLNPGIEENLLRTIDAAGLSRTAHVLGTVVIQSFVPASLRRFHALDPNMPLVQLYRPSGLRSIAETLRTVADYAAGIGPSFVDADRALIETAHHHGLFVHPYTVNSTRLMKRLLDHGADGIFTDHPPRLGAALALIPIEQERKLSA